LRSSSCRDAKTKQETATIANPDSAAAKRSFIAMMGMRKINITEIEIALRG